MKRYRWMLWLVLLAGTGVAVWFWKFREKEKELVLNTGFPNYGQLSASVTATGTIQPVDTVAVGTQVSGTIQKVYVDFNSPVRKGQLLAQLDKSLPEAQVLQISANLQAAKANEVFQKSNYERQKQLFEEKVTSKSELETALYQYESAKANVNSITAQLKSAQRNLAFTNIYSPIDGVVLSRSVSEGQTVAASLNTPTLFSIARDLTRMQVQASVDEADIGNVKPGQRVQFTVDAYLNDTFSGKVNEIRLRASVSANVVSYTTIIDAPNKDLRLKPGMTASITIFTRELNNVLLIPVRATGFRPDSVLRKKFRIAGDTGITKRKISDTTGRKDTEPGVVWIWKENTLLPRQVILGLSDETRIEVVSGLDPEDEIVTGYVSEEKNSKPNNRSPFMPQRSGGGRQRPGP